MATNVTCLMSHTFRVLSGTTWWLHHNRIPSNLKPSPKKFFPPYFGRVVFYRRQSHPPSPPLLPLSTLLFRQGRWQEDRRSDDETSSPPKGESRRGKKGTWHDDDSKHHRGAPISPITPTAVKGTHAPLRRVGHAFLAYAISLGRFDPIASCV